VKTVYGEPIIGEGVTVIPVARVALGLGGGSGRQVGAQQTDGGGGGGGGVIANPIGFIEIRDNTAVFKPIYGPLSRAALPLAVLAAVIVGRRVARAISRCRPQ
jgi:uncharacterized spore protein YtfJ